MGYSSCCVNLPDIAFWARTLGGFPRWFLVYLESCYTKELCFRSMRSCSFVNLPTRDIELKLIHYWGTFNQQGFERLIPFRRITSAKSSVIYSTMSYTPEPAMLVVKLLMADRHLPLNSHSFSLYTFRQGCLGSRREALFARKTTDILEIVFPRKWHDAGNRRAANSHRQRRHSQTRKAGSCQTFKRKTF